MFFRQERCGRSFIKITIYDYWEYAGSIKEAYEIVLKLVQTGYTNDCIYEMKEYLEKF